MDYIGVESSLLRTHTPLAPNFYDELLVDDPT